MIEESYIHTRLGVMIFKAQRTYPTIDRGARYFCNYPLSYVFVLFGALLGSAVFSFRVMAFEELKTIAAINHYSPLEGAYSHGAAGFSFGLGYLSNPIAKELGDNDLTSEVSGESLNGPMITAYLVKGFDIPIDIGITASQIPGSSFEKLGAHAQWTVIEGFKLPSIAVRGSYSRMSRAFQADAANINVSALVDYSFLRYFTTYAGTGTTFHRFKMHDQDRELASARVLSLVESAKQGLEWEERSSFYGLAVKVMPPFVTATVERQVYGQSEDRIVAKLSLGM
jgi:hypothetical protein